MDPRRAHMLFGQAAPYLPGLSQDGATTWMGERPTLPDSLPAIGASRDHPNLYYAFGHHHCGLTQAAISGRLIADLVAGRPPATDIQPFDLARFGAGRRHQERNP
jgi:D-amino-acid dehydrogenase